MTKNKKIIIAFIAIIVVLTIAIWIPKVIVENTLDSLKEDLDATYNEDFKISWNSLEDTPMKKTYHAIVKSNETGITYEVDVKDGVPTMDYEGTNHNAEIDAVVEQQLDGVISLANDSHDGTLTLKIISMAELAEADVLAAGEAVKQQFDFTSIAIETIQYPEEYDFNEVRTQVLNYFERSTLPTEAFNAYPNVITDYEVK